MPIVNTARDFTLAGFGLAAAVSRVDTGFLRFMATGEIRGSSNNERLISFLYFKACHETKLPIMRSPLTRLNEFVIKPGRQRKILKFRVDSERGKRNIRHLATER
jgi:hypothetical protein